MSDSRPRPPRPPTSATPETGDARANVPRAALDALLAGTAGDPLRRALWLDELDRRLRPLLAPTLAAHARLANLDGTRLVFVVDSPIWHAKLRLAGNEILDAARSLGLDVGELVVKTTTQPRRPQARAPSAAKPMSASARTALHDALASLRESGGGTAEDGS